MTVAKARHRCGEFRAAWRARMFGESPYGILRREAENLELMCARAGSSCTLAEDNVLDPVAGVASPATIQCKLARAGFHHSFGVIRERCWVLDKSSRKGVKQYQRVKNGYLDYS